MQVPPVGLDAFRADSSKLPVPPKPFFSGLPLKSEKKKKKSFGLLEKVYGPDRHFFGGGQEGGDMFADFYWRSSRRFRAFCVQLVSAWLRFQLKVQLK